jgi:cytochrome c
LPLAALMPLLLLSACDGEPHLAHRVSGNSENGRLLLQQYGCASCHTIPGVTNARGNAGPSLAQVGRRVYLAGVLPNTPENMARWISAPKQIDPLTAMPDLQVPDTHAQDMVAYLYRLR